ncbi:MAG: iron-sulfur cluster assembly accessory protein [Acidobacteria bacterium]|nr:iron-sulfur cluster assembly accessory protein [Acidobacteriota bacterium]
MSETLAADAAPATVLSVPKEDPFTLQVTDAAVAKVKDFAAKMPDAAGKALRVFIQGGGCSGFQYGFTFDDEKPNDYVLQVKDVRVVVDRASSVKLHGATLNWIEDFRGAGFSVENPNAQSGCGCGKSFS